MKKQFFIFSLMTITLCSCKDSVNPSTSDYIIFGHFYGECSGEKCIEIFKLETNRLLEDTRDIYPNSTNFYRGNYKSMTTQKFNDAKDLLDFFPNDLLTETNSVIGQPDAGDWGGLYIEYNFNGTRKFWLLDQMKRNVPSKYHNFIDKVNEKIKLVQ